MDNLIARRPGPSVQQVFETDQNPAPAIMREESPAIGQSTSDISIDRYFSKEWHDREVEKVWRKTCGLFLLNVLTRAKRSFTILVSFPVPSILLVGVIIK